MVIRMLDLQDNSVVDHEVAETYNQGSTRIHESLRDELVRMLIIFVLVYLKLGVHAYTD